MVNITTVNIFDILSDRYFDKYWETPNKITQYFPGEKFATYIYIDVCIYIQHARIKSTEIDSVSSFKGGISSSEWLNSQNLYGNISASTASTEECDITYKEVAGTVHTCTS